MKYRIYGASHESVLLSKYRFAVGKASINISRQSARSSSASVRKRMLYTLLKFKFKHSVSVVQ